MKTKNLFLAFAASILMSQASFANSLPEGSFKGSTPYVKSPDAMALLIRKDPAAADSYYAILAEYDRIIGAVGSDRVAITKWVPRLYAYHVEKIRDTRYALKPLQVSAAGALEVNAQGGSDFLSLKKAGTLEGAILERYDMNSVIVVETVKFKGKLGSTWEPYVAGNFFGSTDSTGGDYFKKDVNTVLSKDHVATFAQKDVQGQFDVVEAGPGLWTFKSKSPDNKGIEKVETRIGVFIDIVNWKPVFTTDELILANPKDPKDVGFYYERH